MGVLGHWLSLDCLLFSIERGEEEAEDVRLAMSFPVRLGAGIMIVLLIASGQGIVSPLPPIMSDKCDNVVSILIVCLCVYMHAYLLLLLLFQIHNG